MAHISTVSLLRREREDNDRLRSDLAHAQSQLAVANTNSNNSIINNKNYNDESTDLSTTINVTINNYGSEDNSYLKQLSQEALRTLLGQGGRDSMLAYIRALRCDPDHPENHNIRVSDMDTEFMMRKMDDGWQKVRAEMGLKDMAQNDMYSFARVAEHLEEGNAQKLNQLIRKTRAELFYVPGDEDVNGKINKFHELVRAGIVHITCSKYMGKSQTV